ncbi:hypothetical protein PoB_003442900 [Plakobranchus ocellatus]|uniref:Uncharacterized protein n=1 Tax=Plakobranchus ocellatus TaxID=259542 RepID=A0AAV4AJL3_9GAST|nr:hypothetical protein PoB_003442900 [Plakobranchus ocellatus]
MLSKPPRKKEKKKTTNTYTRTQTFISQPHVIINTIMTRSFAPPLSCCSHEPRLGSLPLAWGTRLALALPGLEPAGRQRTCGRASQCTLCDRRGSREYSRLTETGDFCRLL